MNLETRLKSNLIVSAEIKRCDIVFASAVILHRGDDDRGLILIKKYVPANGFKVYMQGRDDNDNLVWLEPLGEQWVNEEKADQYIARQRNFDEDLWVLEVDDPKDLYTPND